MTRNERVYSLAQDWIKWLDERRFFGEPPQKNILAAMRDGRKSKGAPDAPLNAEMVAFNLAVSGLEPGMFVPFVVVYCGHRPKPVKCMADDIGIGRDQFYERAHSSASHILSTTRKLLELSRQIHAEMEGAEP